MKTDTELFRLLMRTSAAARRPLYNDSDESAPHKGRKRGYGHILELLSPSEGLCQQQIAALAGIRPQSVSEALCALESRGHVRREAGVEDKRMVLIYLTPEGEEFRRRAAIERAQRAEQLFAPLTNEEKETLAALLEKLRAAQKEDT